MITEKIFTVGITGASGAIYGVRLVQELLKADYKVHLIVTEAGWQVLNVEHGYDTSDRQHLLKVLFPKSGELHYHTQREFTAPIASGSYRNAGMVIIPCSMGTLSSIANGASNNLLERTADVMLKEGRKLFLVPRETPFNQLHLENMLKVAQVGGKIIPAMPGFYQRPSTMDDLINFVVGKVLDNIGVDHQLFSRWGD
jgi:4-hydroxy-3-polyprenylbenzoate decarboxylase